MTIMGYIICLKIECLLLNFTKYFLPKISIFEKKSTMYFFINQYLLLYFTILFKEFNVRKCYGNQFYGEKIFFSQGKIYWLVVTHKRIHKPVAFRTLRIFKNSRGIVGINFFVNAFYDKKCLLLVFSLFVNN